MFFSFDDQRHRKTKRKNKGKNSRILFVETRPLKNLINVIKMIVIKSNNSRTNIAKSVIIKMRYHLNIYLLISENL